MVSADARSKQGRGLHTAHWIPRDVVRLGIDRSHHLIVLLQVLPTSVEGRLPPIPYAGGAAMSSGARFGSNRSPEIMSFQAMRMTLLATATAASLKLLRLSSEAIHSEVGRPFFMRRCTCWSKA